MPTAEQTEALVRAAEDALEELYVAMQYSRRPAAVRERWERLWVALGPFTVDRASAG